ncbi:uncharacterized protein LOC117343464 [Pecten maximus]|uniref:uncharacterized protein LOC117337584 n=1 Tax=Pecten maximus TaxID=6579 RepID=UPI001458641B|nr:uncharacterized protein LOC117337584 [Pecten maximus]XP_033761712.1 uncharacterized protein LOC117343464 [Pecten maximus]
MDALVSRLRPRRDERKEEVPPIVRQKKKTNAQYQKDFRERMKKDVAVYKSYRAYESLRIQAFRASMTEEQKQKYNEKARIRNQRYRQKKKSEPGFNIYITNKRAYTRNATEKQRETWKKVKRDQRSNMSAQKRRRVNERRRELYALKKQGKKAVSNASSSSRSSSSNTSVVPSGGFPSAAAKRKAISRSLRILPTDANKFADVVSSIIAKTTPNKKAALMKKCITSPGAKKRLDYLETTQMGIRDKIEELKCRRNSKDNRLRRILHSALLAKGRVNKRIKTQFQISRKLATQYEKNKDLEVRRKERKDTLPIEVVNTVENFYGKMYISRELPNQRSVKKDLSVRKALECSLKTTYTKFTEENPDQQISYSKFASLKPDNVLPMTKNKYLQCLCEYCINIDFKVKSLKCFCVQKKIPVVASDRYEMSRNTLCPKEGEYYQKHCIDRECEKCGIDKFGDILARQFQDFSDNQTISWQKWEQDEKTTVVNGNPVSKKYMALKCKTGLVEECLDELKKQLVPFSKHLFNAFWQTKEFEYLKTNIPNKWMLMCLDFAENYCCRHQDEAQSAHWTYEQVTIHPIVAYHRCPVQDCNESMHHSLVFISEDHKHDYHFVQHSVTKANEFLMQSGLEIEKEIHYSDGAPSQYKCKYNFMDLSSSQDDFGFGTEKHFFGSRHGKGPCDGEIGVIKRSASLAVSSRRAVLSNATDFYNFAKNNLSIPKEESSHCHKKRSFFFVKHNDINRNRNSRMENLKTLKDSRSLHSFRGIQSGIVTSRERSCFCKECVGPQNEMGVCQHQNLTGTWKISNLKTNPRNGAQRGARGAYRARGARRGARGTRREVTAGSDTNSESEYDVDMTECERTRGARRGARTRGARRGARARGAQQGARTRGARRGARARGARRGARGAQQGARARGAQQGARGTRREVTAGSDTSSESEYDDVDMSECEDEIIPESDHGTSQDLDDPVGHQETSFTSDRDALEILNIEVPVLFDNETDESYCVDMTSAVLDFLNSSLIEEKEPPAMMNDDGQPPVKSIHSLIDENEPPAMMNDDGQPPVESIHSLIDENEPPAMMKDDRQPPVKYIHSLIDENEPPALMNDDGQPPVKSIHSLIDENEPPAMMNDDGQPPVESIHSLIDENEPPAMMNDDGQPPVKSIHSLIDENEPPAMMNDDGQPPVESIHSLIDENEPPAMMNDERQPPVESIHSLIDENEPPAMMKDDGQHPADSISTPVTGLLICSQINCCGYSSLKRRGRNQNGPLIPKSFVLLLTTLSELFQPLISYGKEAVDFTTHFKCRPKLEFGKETEFCYK